MIPAPPSKGRDNTPTQKQGNGVPYFSNEFFNLLDVEKIRTVLKTQPPQSKEVGVCSFSPNLTLNLTEGREYFIFDKNTYIKVIKENDSLNVKPYFVEKPFYYSYDNKNQMRVSDKKDFSDVFEIDNVNKNIEIEKRQQQISNGTITNLKKLLNFKNIHGILFVELDERIKGLDHILNLMKNGQDDIDDTKVSDVLSAFREGIFMKFLGIKDEEESDLEETKKNIINFVNVLKKDTMISNRFVRKNTLPANVQYVLSDDTYRHFLALSLLLVMQSEKEQAKFTTENFHPKNLVTPKIYQQKMNKEFAIEKNDTKEVKEEKRSRIEGKMNNFKAFANIYKQLINFTNREETINKIGMNEILFMNSTIRLKALEAKRDKHVKKITENVVKIEKSKDDIQTVSSRTGIKIVNEDLDKEFLSVLNNSLSSLLPSAKNANSSIVQMNPQSYNELNSLKLPKGTPKSKQLFDKGKTKSYLLKVLSDIKPHPSVTYEDESKNITSRVRWLVDCLGSLDSVVELRNDILLESSLEDPKGNWFPRQIKTVK